MKYCFPSSTVTAPHPQKAKNKTTEKMELFLRRLLLPIGIIPVMVASVFIWLITGIGTERTLIAFIEYCINDKS